MINPLTYLIRKLSPRNQILQWELPRLLAAIERLQRTIDREIAGDKVREACEGTMSELMLSHSLDRLKRQVKEINESSQRIRDLLGY